MYTDEVNDGIAHAAKEQAEVWAIAAEEEGNETDFVRDLVTLTSKYISKRSGPQRAGELGTKSRLQPRYQKGRALEYDRVVSARMRDEQSKQVARLQRAETQQSMAEAEQEARLRALGKSEEEIAGLPPRRPSLRSGAAVATAATAATGSASSSPAAAR